MASVQTALLRNRETLIVKLADPVRSSVLAHAKERVEPAVTHSLAVAAMLPEWWEKGKDETGDPVSTRLFLNQSTIDLVKQHSQSLHIPKRQVLQALLWLALTDEQNILYTAELQQPVAIAAADQADGAGVPAAGLSRFPSESGPDQEEDVDLLEPMRHAYG